jgi:hypothetical protein
MMKKRTSRLAFARYLKSIFMLTLIFNFSFEVKAQIGGQAITTNFSGELIPGEVIDGPVVRLVDIHNPLYTGFNIDAPRQSWTWNASVIGQVYGIAINPNNQDVFVTASSVYENYGYSESPFAYGPGGSGGIYRLNPVTGVVTTLVFTIPFGIPNVSPLPPPLNAIAYISPNVAGTNTIPNGTLTEPGPGLGNICFDKKHGKLFVTNFEDGKIYRIDPTTGIIDDVYDPVAGANPGGNGNQAMYEDVPTPGHAPWGDNLFGIAYNEVENRIYYGVCVKDIWTSGTRKNSIRSIGLNGAGKMTGSDQFEIAIDNYANNSSGVISDISFNYPDGQPVQMAVAGRSLNPSFKSAAYASNAELYKGYSNSWSKSTTYAVGNDSGSPISHVGKNCSGGIDFGYTSFDASTNINTGFGDRIWMTSHNMLNDPNFGDWLFGIHSTPTSGNNSGTGSYRSVGHFIDIYGDDINGGSATNPLYGRDYTREIGDIEIFRTASETEVFCTLEARAGEDDFVCEGESATLGAYPAAIGGLGPYTYDWTDVDGNLISNQEHPIVYPVELTTYYLMVTDKNGCVSHDDVTIAVIHPPANQTICDGESVDIKMPRNPLPTSVTFVVINPVTGQPFGISTDYTVNPANTTNYNWSYGIGDKQCSGTMTVTVNPNPTADAGGPLYNDGNSICAGKGIQLGGAQTAVGGTPGYTYKWEAAGGNDPNPDTHPNPIAYPYVNTIYTVVVTDANGCKDEDQVSVTVRPGPYANAGPDQGICKGATGGATIGTPAIPGNTYNWSEGPTFAPVISNNPIINVNPAISTTYMLVVGAPDGCKSRDYVNVSISDVQVDAGDDRILCNGSFTQLGGNPTAQGGTSPYIFDWNNDVLDIENPWDNPDETTIYNVEVTDVFGCTGQDQVEVEVIGSVLIVDPGADRTICSGITTMLGGGTTAQGTGVYVYQWSVNGTLFSAEPNPQVQPVNTTEYDLIVTDQLTGCAAAASVTVTVNQTPQITISSDRAICLGDYTQLYVNATGSGNTYQWGPATGLSCTTCPNPNANPIVNTKYCVYVTSGNECAPEENLHCVVVEVNPVPIANAGPDITLCEGKWVAIGGVPTADGGTPFTPTIGNPYYNYSWTDMNGNSVFGNQSNPDFVTGPTNIYTVKVTDSNGCTDTDDVTITTFPDIEFVNNSGFEDGITPITRGQITNEYTNNTWFASSGDPDLFDENFSGCLNQLLQPTCLLDPVDFNCVGIPCNHFGYQKHRLNSSGNIGRYAGLSSLVTILDDDYFYPVNSLTPDDLHFIIEGLEQQLATPLTVGQDYCVNLVGSLAENGDLTGVTSDNEAQFVIKLSTQARYGGNTIITGIPVPLPVPTSGGDIIYQGTFDDISNWEYVSVDFTATKAYTHIIIESYFDETIFQKVQSLIANPATSELKEFLGLQSYFYIDDVEIHKQACCYYEYMSPAGFKSEELISADENIIEEKSVLKLFPNPTSGELNIQLNTDSEEPAFVKVYTLDAKLVSEKQELNVTNNGITTINLSHIPQGIYYVELVQGEQIIRERIVVQ